MNKSNTKTNVEALCIAIKASNDEPDIKTLYLNWVQTTIRNATEYVEKVSTQEFCLQEAKSIMDASDYQEFAENLGNSRSRYHSALVSNVNILNRACVRFGTKLIAQDVDPDNLSTYSDWALLIVNEYFTPDVTQGE